MLDKKNKIAVTYEEISSREVRFVISPLNPGFGVTYGNLYRRVLLSSMGGSAICAAKIKGVDHLYSSIDGVVEDVLEIMLNLKQVRLKKKSDAVNKNNGEYTNVSINLSKTRAFMAKDIEQFTNNYEVCNPDFVICNMSPGVNLEIDLKIVEGIGYLVADELDKSLLQKGYLTVDCIFSPIINVKFKVENERIGNRTDFDKLILEITSDGSAYPLELLVQASKIVRDDIVAISNFNKQMIEDDEDDISTMASVDDLNTESLSRRKILRKEIRKCGDEGLTTRSVNCLRGNNILTIGDLLKTPKSEISAIKKLGKKSLTEIVALVEKYKDENCDW